MRQLRIRKLAGSEIDAAFVWYARHSPVAAERFLEALDEAISRILDGPEQHPIIRGRLRRVLLRHFPFAVYYKVFPTVISVVGVIHGHRHPRTWLARR